MDDRRWTMADLRYLHLHSQDGGWSSGSNLPTSYEIPYFTMHGHGPSSVIHGLSSMVFIEINLPGK
jgi:hypothetical protein